MKYKKGKKMRKKSVVVLTATMMLCFATFAVAASPRGNGGEVYYESVEIGYGDTLWSIAAEYTKNGESTKHKVREIMEFNGMKTEDIRSGEKILVPVRE